MHLVTLALLDRRLARVRKEHVWRLQSILDESLQIVRVDRPPTVSESLEHFKQATVAAQSEYGAKVRGEILSVVEQTQRELSAAGKAAVLKLSSKYFHAALYMERFGIYEGALVRHVRRHGSSMELAVFRPDLVKSLYEVGSINFVQSTSAALADDLELIVQRAAPVSSSRPSMPEGKLEQANRFVKLEPNFFGIGFNLNYVIRRLLGKRE